MYIVTLPPAEFIDRVLKASIGNDEFLGYGALAVLLARSADAAAVQDRVERDWSSIHDVTGSEVLVITPISKGRDEACVMQGSYGTSGEGLTFRTALQQHWRKSFRGGHYAPDTPKRSSWRKASTHAVTDTLHYFGLPEWVSPCLLVLVFWDNDAYLARVDDLFNPYSFFRDIASHGNPDVIHSIRDLSKQIMDLDRPIAAENRRLSKENSSDQLRWRLGDVGRALPECSSAIAELDAALRGGSPMGGAELSDLIDPLSIALRKATLDGRIPKDFADNLRRSLRVGLTSFRAATGGLTLPTHQKKAKLMAEIREAQGERRLGEAVAYAAMQQGLEESQLITMRWHGSQAHMFDRQNRAPSLIYAGISRTGNV
jgi:hypothetical protein